VGVPDLQAAVPVNGGEDFITKLTDVGIIENVDVINMSPNKVRNIPVLSRFEFLGVKDEGHIVLLVSYQGQHAYWRLPSKIGKSEIIRQVCLIQEPHIIEVPFSISCRRLTHIFQIDDELTTIRGDSLASNAQIGPQLGAERFETVLGSISGFFCRIGIVSGNFKRLLGISELPGRYNLGVADGGFGPFCEPVRF